MSVTAESLSARERSSVGRATARLCDWLGSGAVPRGELVPSERALSGMLGLSRGTLRSALRKAENDGLLRREGTRLLHVGGKTAVDPWTARAVAVLVPTQNAAAPATRPWARYVTLGVSEAIRAAGHHAITLNEEALDGADLAALIAAKPAGLVLPELAGRPERASEIAAAFVAGGVQTVAYGDAPTLARFDRVVSDHEAGSYTLTRVLLDQGRRPVRFWRRPWDNWWLRARGDGYVRAMTEAGRAPLPVAEYPNIVMHQSTIESFEAAVRPLVGFTLDALRLPGGGADALMVTSDRDAFYAAAAVRRLGLRPGEDVVIAGYDNCWSLCGEAALTAERPSFTVDKRNEHTGRLMLELLLAGEPAGVAGRRPLVRRVTPDVVRVG